MRDRFTWARTRNSPVEVADLDAHPSDGSYLLMTPGPISTTATVKAAMQRDYSTWDADYHAIVQQIRTELVGLATSDTSEYTVVLMPGSGTFGVEATLGSVVPDDGKLLILANGAYGARMVQMAEVLRLPHRVEAFPETVAIPVDHVRSILAADTSMTHIAFVHCETTTGLLNPIEELTDLAHAFGKCIIVDAMSSFGGIPMDLARLHVDFLITSANKCIQGVPGFSIVIARRAALRKVSDIPPRSISLSLYDQWRTMEQDGKWRFTSPTHAILAFWQALEELRVEGGISARHRRYMANQTRISEGMVDLGFLPLIDSAIQSPIITTFLYPKDGEFVFDEFYRHMKVNGFVIYPGKLTAVDTLRIGSIGDMHPSDLDEFLLAAAAFRRPDLSRA